MTDLVFDIPSFRLAFPAFANEGIFSADRLTIYYGQAGSYLSPSTYGWIRPNDRYYGLTLLTAHIAQLGADVASGDGGGIVSSSTIDKVSVTMLTPPVTNSFDWWLSQTPYGLQYLAWLKVKSSAGLYIGGHPEKAAFRRSFGVFK